MAANQDSGHNSLKTLSWQSQACPAFTALPWGPHRLPIFLSLDSLSLSLEKSGAGYPYRRAAHSGAVEKLVLPGKGQTIPHRSTR